MLDFEIVNHGVIRSEGDFVRLGIVDWQRYHSHWTSPQQAMKRVSEPFIGEMFFLLQGNLSDAPKRSDFPGWKHAGRHEEIGRRFWNHFHHYYTGTLHFHDQPDLSGEIENNGQKWRLYGDIGLVSPITLLEVSQYFSTPNKLWMSVVDEHNIVVIEKGTDYEEKYQKLPELLKPAQGKWNIAFHKIFIELENKQVILGTCDEVLAMTPAKIKRLINSVMGENKPAEPITLTRSQTEPYTQLALF